MKRIIAAIVLNGLFLAACSKRQDIVPEGAGVADLHFSRDTICVREKDYTNINNTGNGMVLVYSSPAAHQLNLSYSEPTGKVHFSYRGVRLTDSKPFVVAADSSGIFCSADTAGLYPVDFYLTDQLGRVVTKTLVVKCAAGVKPIADLQYELVSASTDNWLYYFSAAGSRQPFGAIVSYHYLINGEIKVTTYPLLKWFFHDKGIQSVSFWVTDDLGISSDTLTYSIQIP